MKKATEQGGDNVANQGNWTEYAKFGNGTVKLILGEKRSLSLSRTICKMATHKLLYLRATKTHAREECPPINGQNSGHDGLPEQSKSLSSWGRQGDSELVLGAKP